MKNFIPTAVIVFLTCQIFAGDVSQDKTETDAIFSVGKFNGKPETADSALEKDEFKTLSSIGNTIQVKQKNQFPQRLQPGQRMALFLENIDSKMDLQLETATVIGKDVNYDSIPSMELRYNGNVFYRGKQLWEGKRLRLFVPKIWNEKGVNVIEIRNLGINPIAFDALSVRKYFNPAQAEESANKQIELPSKIRSIASSAGTTSETNSILRDKVTRFLPNKIMEYLNNGGEPFSFEKFSGLENFYDPYTGKPILAHYALAAIVPLFEGAPEKILCDIIPSAQDNVLHGTIWSAVRNNENTITLAVATTPEDLNKCAEIILPVPWSGDNDEVSHFLSANLKTDLWQRIVLPLDKCGIPCGFRMVGNPKFPEYKNGNKVSFEINGISEIDDKSSSGLVSIRDLSGLETCASADSTVNEGKNKTGEGDGKTSKSASMKTKTIILTGNPEAYFEYRYDFKEPVDFKKVSSMSENKEIQLIWHKDAQVLEIKGHFSKNEYQPKEELLGILSQKEKDMIAKKGIVPLGIKISYE